MNTPLISIIVPCYNQAIYLPDTLSSVLEQNYPHWECIIVNDGSLDDTERVAKEWTTKDNRFKYFYKINSGVSDTRNFGISKAEGKYILPLDGDDKIGTEYISRAIEVFEANPNTKLVYSDVILFGAQNYKLKNPDYNFERMLTENLISVAGIFKKTDFWRTGGYNTNMVEGLEDWDFWLSFLRPEDKVVKLEGFHLYYRIKEVSRSQQIDHVKNEKLLLQIFKNHIPLFLEYFNPIRNKIEAEAYKHDLEWHYNSKEYKLGRAFFAPYRFIKKIYHLISSKEE